MTLLESRFPYRAVSMLVAADRRAPDPAYQAHRWWARRPPALVRAALLAASMPAEATDRDFWSFYASAEHHLADLAVHDPFLGGGTTLVEAARLGATVTGSDVDPLAVHISEHQLTPPPAAEVLAAGELLLGFLRRRLGGFWAASKDADGQAWQPLHYFFVARVSCPDCGHCGPLFRSLVLARSIGKVGGVRRDVAVTAFCPSCLSLHDLEAGEDTLSCCAARWPLKSASFERRAYTCPGCQSRSSHERLQTGTAERVLIGVEEIPVGVSPARRRIRAPRPADRSAMTRAAKWSAPVGAVDPVRTLLVAGAGDQRPLSYGVRTVGDLHTSRQVAYLTEAFNWIESAGLNPAVATALRLAVSTTITCNNRLCGYATDYGRLAPLFSVRAFSLPWLTVELNPLNATGGRGTLAAALTRVAGSCSDTVRRNVIDGRRQVVPATMELTRINAGHRLVNADATKPAKCNQVADSKALADVCLTDPPYFDFIPYDTLSQVFRAWATDSDLAGTPLLPAGDDPVTAFGSGLGSALSAAMSSCKEGALLAFTYKGDQEAWQAVGVALDEAKMRVTALWPVLADPHMGHHSHEGNCEYDVLVVARSLHVTEASDDPRLNPDVALKGLRRDRRVSKSDATNLRAACDMADSRWGVPTGDTTATR